MKNGRTPVLEKSERYSTYILNMEKYQHYRQELDKIHVNLKRWDNEEQTYQIILELIDKAEREGVRLGTLATNNY